MDALQTKREQTLLDRHIQPTAMRLLVLEELQKLQVAVSLNELEANFDRADRITLYRTLKTFQKNKLVHSIDDGTGSVKYALCSDQCECRPEEQHAHFHCNKCDLTICLNDFHLQRASLPKHFVMQEMNLVIKGLCDHCSDGT
ncbi:Fur family transcriptional regulator, ferric uptake regulator [bacterium A37T11]|nr:Fur family transcriptional regulator, ferric uptake regulator [bacterium A37T11]